MAIIDATFRKAVASTDASVREMFDRIKGRRIRIRPPENCVVQNTFVKIRQDERGGEAGQYVPTIAYREFVFFSGVLEIAIDVAGHTDAVIREVADAAAHVNYFGKRGSFFQYTQHDVQSELPHGFTLAGGDSPAQMPLGYGVTQYLDDFGPDLCVARDGFERISTFHGGDIKLGKHRILVSTLLPYRQVEASRSFTRYTTRPAQD